MPEIRWATKEEMNRPTSAYLGGNPLQPLMDFSKFAGRMIDDELPEWMKKDFTQFDWMPETIKNFAKNNIGNPNKGSMLGNAFRNSDFLPLNVRIYLASLFDNAPITKKQLTSKELNALKKVVGNKKNGMLDYKDYEKKGASNNWEYYTEKNKINTASGIDNLKNLFNPNVFEQLQKTLGKSTIRNNGKELFDIYDFAPNPNTTFNHVVSKSINTKDPYPLLRYAMGKIHNRGAYTPKVLIDLE